MRNAVAGAAYIMYNCIPYYTVLCTTRGTRDTDEFKLELASNETKLWSGGLSSLYIIYSYSK